MSVSMKALGIDKMSYEERCLLVEEIMASLAAEEAISSFPTVSGSTWSAASKRMKPGRGPDPAGKTSRRG